ncbi:MAG: ribosome biogenesis GTPase Der [Bacteroidota bacterium]
MFADTQHIVAIVGRPNVGKSTLFNRMIGRSKAITTPEAGGTRDRNYDLSEWCSHTFTLVDTGGYLPGEGPNFEKAIREQIKIAIQECHLILFVVDCQTGLLPDDHTIASLLRQSGKPVVVAANKADNYERTLSAPTFHALGLGEPYAISATHGSGTGDLMDAIVEKLPTLTDLPKNDENPLPRLAFIGKPNAGKSTLVNVLLNQERSIVSSRAHTTRDTLHSHYKRYNQDLILIDTAGIYRKNKKKEAIEFYSVIRSVKAIQQSDICILLVSAEEGLTKQDLDILRMAHRHKKGIVIAINKWDLIDKDKYDIAQYRKDLAKALGTLAYVPVLFISGLKKQRIYQLIEKATEVYQNRKQHVPTSQLMKVIEEATTRTPHPVIKGKFIKIKYVTQMPFSSPTFALFANLPQYITKTYKRYLINQIREKFNFEGCPITLVAKKK